MNRGTVITGLGLAGLLALAGGRAHAAGFQLQEQSGSGLGLAYSGMPVAVQDASTAFWNPAGMPLLPGVQLAAAAHYIDSSFDFVSAGGPPSGSTYNVFGEGGDAGTSNVVPALYGTFAVTPRFSVGLALDTPFGLSTEWDSPWAGMFAAIRSEVKTYNINPTLGFKVNDWLYLGAGVDYQRLHATLTNALTPLLPAAQAQLKGDDWAWGWNVGALARLGERAQIGLTYRSSLDYTITGDLTVNSAAQAVPTLAALASGVRADLKLPKIIAAGVSYQFVPSLRALADVTWTRWDSVQTLTIIATSGVLEGQPVTGTVLNFKNSWRAGVGLEYQLTPAWLVRGGLAYDRSPVQDIYRTPKLPDDDRRWLAAGVRFQPNPKWSVDFGYAHLWVLRAPSELTSFGAVPGALIGHYDSSSNIVAAQASFRF